MKEFIRTNIVIDAHKTFFSIDKNGEVRKAEIYGGRKSQKGLTIWPDYVEKDHIIGYSEYAVINFTDTHPFKIKQDKIVVFKGHGADCAVPVEVINTEELLEKYKNWLDYRKYGYNPYDKNSYVDFLARARTFNEAECFAFLCEKDLKNFLNLGIIEDGRRIYWNRYEMAFVYEGYGILIKNMNTEDYSLHTYDKDIYLYDKKKGVWGTVDPVENYSLFRTRDINEIIPKVKWDEGLRPFY